MMNGIILFNKPAGISSAGVVNSVKRLLPHGVRVGHAGTLDPFATGLLILLVGGATKLCEAMMNQPKQYEATIRLGATTDTDDIESPEKLRTVLHPPPLPAIQAELKKFEGDIDQIPPAYSALKIRGKRACDRIRAGETIETKPRRVHIDHIQLLSYDWPLAKIRVDCGRGTYIRSIARDLGQSLGVGGYLSQLRRTRSGQHRIEQAATLEQLKADGVERYLLQPTLPTL